MTDLPPAVANGRPMPGTFEHFLGMSFEAAPDGHLLGSVLVREDFVNPPGFPHGGVAFSLADSTMGFTLYRAIASRGQVGVTAEMSARFLRSPKVGERLYCRPRIVHLGSTTAVCEAEVADASGRLIFKAAATFVLRAPRKAGA